MWQQALALPAAATPAQVVAAIEAGCAHAGLTQALKTTLQKFPGCTHWHYKLSGQPGTLEVTYWPAKAQAWLSLHHNRRAAWMETRLPGLVEAIQAALVI